METNSQKIIRILGGSKAVAADLKTNQSRVSNWLKRGIPEGRYLDLIDAAPPGSKQSVKFLIKEIREEVKNGG
jgi:hypothetical protein